MTYTLHNRLSAVRVVAILFLVLLTQLEFVHFSCDAVAETALKVASRCDQVDLSLSDQKPDKNDFMLPKPEDIQAIVAETYSHPFGGADISPFNVPASRFREVVDRFDGSKLVTGRESEGSWSEIGTFRIVLKNGASLRLCWYMDEMKARLHFSCAGRRFIKTGKRFATDENLAMTVLTAEICDQVNKDDRRH